MEYEFMKRMKGIEKQFRNGEKLKEERRIKKSKGRRARRDGKRVCSNKIHGVFSKLKACWGFKGCLEMKFRRSWFLRLICLLLRCRCFCRA